MCQGSSDLEDALSPCGVQVQNLVPINIMGIKRNGIESHGRSKIMIK